MSYSRRQLYAMGEPLGESTTRMKDGGFGRIYGGGGGQQSQTSTQTQVSDIPGRLQPYQMDILNKGQALTDVNQNPYQAYGGNRVANLGALQQTAIGNVATPQAWGQNVQGYMSPYMDNVVKRQQQNAIEQAGTQMGALNARAAQSGAFGGSGIALQRAAQNRDLQRQLGDIESSGLQNAWQQGTQQANTALGQQMQLGALQQQKEQQGLDIAYQNFMDQKNYPYQQLSYFSNLLRGTPMGMNSTSQVYQAAPSLTSQVAGLGTALYAGSKLAAKGGSTEDIKKRKSGSGLEDLGMYNATK